jgi:hypothetical protein
MTGNDGRPASASVANPTSSSMSLSSTSSVATTWLTSAAMGSSATPPSFLRRPRAPRRAAKFRRGQCFWHTCAAIGHAAARAAAQRVRVAEHTLRRSRAGPHPPGRPPVSIYCSLGSLNDFGLLACFSLALMSSIHGALAPGFLHRILQIKPTHNPVMLRGRRHRARHSVRRGLGSGGFLLGSPRRQPRVPSTSEGSEEESQVVPEDVRPSEDETMILQGARR